MLALKIFEAIVKLELLESMLPMQAVLITVKLDPPESRLLFEYFELQKSLEHLELLGELL